MIDDEDGEPVVTGCRVCDNCGCDYCAYYED